MDYLILAINPGSTSTKIALYKNEEILFKESIEHPQEELEQYSSINDQIPMRRGLVLDSLERNGYNSRDLSLVMGRGGLFPPIRTGGYLVNEKMLRMVRDETIPAHASNLGALLAHEIAECAGIKAYIYDAVSANEFPPIAKITGIPEVERKSLYHVLNSRAVAISYAKSQGKRYDEMNLIVAHLGGGVTFGAHEKGKIIDSLSDDNGAFSPERAGNVPLLDVIEMCYSGKYERKEMIRKVRGLGGLRALLGTSDCRLLEQRIADGDEYANLVMMAQAYQIAKGIGLLSPVLLGVCDAIILTGGLAYSQFITSRVIERVEFIAPVVIIPGEHEMEALALGGLRIARGEEEFYEM